MYFLSFRVYSRIILKSIIISLILTSIIFGLVNMVQINANFANYICKISEIPYDLELTIMSAGFGNNIIILLLSVEIGIICYILYKIVNTKPYKMFVNFITNL